jgi:hypothetical protein
MEGRVMERTRSNIPTCMRCQQKMQMIADIEPIGSMSGMQIFHCKGCGASDYLPDVPSAPRP